MKETLIPIAELPDFIHSYLPFSLPCSKIYQSVGLEKHIQKRHALCLPYMDKISEIIVEPDYVGVNPHETDVSFELVKIFQNGLKIGIKLDTKENYLYVATLHEITDAKIARHVEKGRLKVVDKTAKND